MSAEQHIFSLLLCHFIIRGDDIEYKSHVRGYRFLEDINQDYADSADNMQRRIDRLHIGGGRDAHDGT